MLDQMATVVLATGVRINRFETQSQRQPLAVVPQNTFDLGAWKKRGTLGSTLASQQSIRRCRLIAAANMPSSLPSDVVAQV